MLFVYENKISMNYIYLMIILLLPFTSPYPRQYSTNLNDFLNMYLKLQNENSEKINKDSRTGGHYMSRLMPLHYQQQPTCLPHIWTCGPHLPPCCSGLMCYDGNAKRGRYCVARG
jgi:hypothetical protein